VKNLTAEAGTDKPYCGETAVSVLPYRQTLCAYAAHTTSAHFHAMYSVDTRLV
jgi:hypothetical protein